MSPIAPGTATSGRRKKEKNTRPAAAGCNYNPGFIPGSLYPQLWCDHNPQFILMGLLPLTSVGPQPVLYTKGPHLAAPPCFLVRPYLDNPASATCSHHRGPGGGVLIYCLRKGDTIPASGTPVAPHWWSHASTGPGGWKILKSEIDFQNGILWQKIHTIQLHRTLFLVNFISTSINLSLEDIF